MSFDLFIDGGESTAIYQGFDKTTRPMEKSNIKTRGGGPMNGDQGRKARGPLDSAGVIRSLIFFIAAMSVAACGGVDEKLAGVRKPHIKPHLWWSGKHRGRRIILDRNRNIMQTAAVERECRAEDVTRGSCSETVEYLYRKSPETPPIREKYAMQWSIVYDDDTRMTVEVKGTAGNVRGTVLGTVMLLEGERRIPLQKERSASVSIRYDQLPGPGEPVLETRSFTMLGIGIGTVETYWTRLPR